LVLGPRPWAGWLQPSYLPLRRFACVFDFEDIESCLGVMQGPAADRHILDWDETDVHSWLSSLGYPQYESQIRGILFTKYLIDMCSNIPFWSEHKIQGDSLCELDSEGLRILGITSMGRRLAILKSIYQVKLSHNVPIDEAHYIPPCLSTLVYGVNDY